MTADGRIPLVYPKRYNPGFQDLKLKHNFFKQVSIVREISPAESQFGLICELSLLSHSSKHLKHSSKLVF